MTNRLRVPRASAEAVSSSAAQHKSQVSSAAYTRSKTAGEAPITFFAPIHYEPNYGYPLLVWLHGPGDDENQLKRIMPFVSLRNHVGVSVCGTTPYTSPSGKAGFTWAQSPPHVALAEQRVFDALAAVQARYHIAPRRIFLAGFDAGGTMALRLALSHPHRFSGGLSLGGEFPVGGAPLSALTEARRVPIFLACTRDSRRYPSAVVCENLKLLHSAGISLTLREYPRAHGLLPAMLSDVDRWIMELVTSGATSGCAGEG